MTNFKTAKKKSAFTLIEMLVVMSVIGVLLSAAGYNHTRVMRHSKDAALKVELSHLRNAIHQFALDHSGRFPQLLEELSPDYIREVPQLWRGSQAQGKFFYNNLDGVILLYDMNQTALSDKTDEAGRSYGDY